MIIYRFELYVILYLMSVKFGKLMWVLVYRNVFSPLFSFIMKKASFY